MKAKNQKIKDVIETITDDEVLENVETTILQFAYKHIWKFAIVFILVLAAWACALAYDYSMEHISGVKTKAAVRAAQEVTLEAQSYFVRDESTFHIKNGQSIVPLLENGARVSKNEEYAFVFANEADAQNLLKLQRLEHRLDWLRESNDNVNYHVVDVAQLHGQVAETFSAFLGQLDETNFESTIDARDTFLNYATTLEVALNGKMDLSEEIAAAERELRELRNAGASATDRLTAPEAGNYFNSADGLESVLTPEAILPQSKNGALTPEKWNALIQTPAAGDAKSKIVRGFTWYAVVVLPRDEAQQLLAGTVYKVRFPLETASEFQMKVLSVQGGKDDQAAVVFVCTEQNDAIYQLRTAKISIVTGVFEGLEIPSSALRTLEKTDGLQRRSYRGVYVLSGSKVIPKEVRVLYQTGEKTIVAHEQTPEVQSLPGDRVTVSGQIASVVDKKPGTLTVVGKNLSILAENTKYKPAVKAREEDEEDAPAFVTVTTARANVCDEINISGDDMQWREEDGNLVITGAGFAYREVLGTILKMYDPVIYEGRIPINAVQ
ncbi:MAG: hypothetical protein LBB67_06810 [Oscillospiraceae bacterium]|jgi:hypothetical protein|nr:hypothetical protein [Oscillospiraceae bacterium]